MKDDQNNQSGRYEQQSTSILELLYLMRAKNKGELSFAECMECALSWARAVIAESETETKMGQQLAPSESPMPADECPSGQ